MTLLAIRHLTSTGLVERTLLSLKKLCLLPVTSERYYRGRKTAGIGRTYGLKGVGTCRHLKLMEGAKGSVFRSTSHTYNETLKFKITGHDIVLVENFAKVVHHLFQKLNYKINEMYAEPTHEREIKEADSLAANAESMKTMFSISCYTRVFTVNKLPTHAKPILIHMMMYFVPQSVSFEVSPLTTQDGLKRMQRRVGLEEAIKELKMIRGT